MGKLKINTSIAYGSLSKKVQREIVTDFISRNKNIVKDTITQKNLKVTKEFVDNVIEKIIKPQIPVKSGKLKNSIRAKVEFDKQNEQITIQIRFGWYYAHQLPYATYILEGTKAHTIPQGGSSSGLVLKFKGSARYRGSKRSGTKFTKKLNTDVYVRSVYVRGIRANNFLIKGIDFISRNLSTVLINGLTGIKYNLR